MTTFGAPLHPGVLYGLLFLGAVVSPLLGMNGSPAAARVQADGRPLQQELRAGERLSVDFKVEVGATYTLTVEQIGLDVEVSLHDPQGHELLRVDSPQDRMGRERLTFEAAMEGDHRIELHAREAGAPPGSFRLRATRWLEKAASIARSTGADRLIAELALTRAGRHYLTGDRDGRLLAAEAEAEALAAWRGAGESREAAESLYRLAVLHRLLDQPAEALALAQESATAWQSFGHDPRQSASWNEAGLDHWLLGSAEEARRAFDRARTLAEEEGDAWGRAVAASNGCLMDLVTGRLIAGLDCYAEALPLWQPVQAPALEGAALLNVGRGYDLRGEPARAFEAYRQALDRQRATGNQQGEARTLNNLALLQQQMGHYDEALADYAAALESFKTLEDTRWQARVLNNLSLLYFGLGDDQQASHGWRQALSLWQEVEDREGEASTSTNLALVAAQRGDFQEALELHQHALSLRQETGDLRAKGISLVHLARLHLALGEPALALPMLATAESESATTGDFSSRIEILRVRSLVELALGRIEPAKNYLSQALAKAREGAHPTALAKVLVAQARLEEREGSIEPALDRVHEAIETLEGLRIGLLNPDLLVGFSGLQSELDGLRLQLLMEAHRRQPAAGWNLRALEAWDASRVRTLVDLLEQQRIEPRGEAAARLANRRNLLNARLSAKSALIRRAKDEDRAALEGERLDLLRELDLTEAELKAASPEFASLTRPDALSAAEIRALLDPDTLLLVYALGSEGSVLWLVREESIETFELAPAEQIEAAARALHQGLTHFDPATRGADRQAAKELARLVLPPSIGPLDRRRLVVMSDRTLAYIPFAILPDPASDQPLIQRHEVTTIPSASALAAQRRQAFRRPAARRPLAVIADPVFTPSDPRLGATASLVNDSHSLQRLAATGREAETLADLAPAGQVLQLVGFSADRDALLQRNDLADYRVVHFATHGVLDAQRPALSGLHLSRLDAAGAPREGFLSLRDVYGLDLAANLVVLSGCRTALGREVRGEGLVGLTRGFLYAGAERVLASLWQVDDRATAALMKHFYRGLWHDGLTPATALRQAQLAIRAERRWRDPHFWSAFVLDGDWRDMDGTPPRPHSPLIPLTPAKGKLQ